MEAVLVIAAALGAGILMIVLGTGWRGPAPVNRVCPEGIEHCRCTLTLAEKISAIPVVPNEPHGRKPRARDPDDPGRIAHR